MAPNTIPSMAKVAGNYLGGQLIKMEALANGFAEAIALGTDGLLSEGSGQNVFIVSNGTVITPPVNGTLLAGITRDSILSLTSDLGIPVKEMPVPREMLYGADEVFLTGTASEVTPVRSVDRITIGRGRRGPVTEQIQRHFLEVVHGRVADRHGWLTFVRDHAGERNRATAAAAAGRA
jgi:branched-chain amino acid aminotransferase